MSNAKYSVSEELGFATTSIDATDVRAGARLQRSASTGLISTIARRVVAVARSVDTARTGRSATNATNRAKDTSARAGNRGLPVRHVGDPTTANMDVRRRSVLKETVVDPRDANTDGINISVTIAVDPRCVHATSRNTPVPTATSGIARVADKKRQRPPTPCVRHAFHASRGLRSKRFI